MVRWPSVSALSKPAADAVAETTESRQKFAVIAVDAGKLRSPTNR